MSNIKQVLCLAFISLRLNLLLMLLLLIAPNLLPVESLFGNHRITAERYFPTSFSLSLVDFSKNALIDYFVEI